MVAVNLAALAGGWSGCAGTVPQNGGKGGGLGTGGAASSSSTVAVAGGTGGSAGIGAGGAGGVSAEGGGCASAPTKECDGKCVSFDDPAYGCASGGCAACPMQYPNASQACHEGLCAFGSCDTGFADCNDDDVDGCESNLATDPANCGACGASCLIHATADCTLGMCTNRVCDPGWTDCNGDPTDGCEANLQNDPANCGTCANECPVGWGCEQGICSPGCPKGNANCPGDPPDVCATKLGTDQNCAYCGDACGSNGTCVVVGFNPTCAACDPGLADCDGDASNGCEVDTQNDPAHCGQCGVQCGGQVPCVTGVCAAGGGDGG